jgi:hypothetical protein
VSSRLLQFEIWNRLHAQGFDESHAESATALLASIAIIELSPPVLERALDPFPVPVRTLDGLHLATAFYLHSRRTPLQLASYDRRMCAAAAAMGIGLYELS